MMPAGLPSEVTCAGEEVGAADCFEEPVLPNFFGLVSAWSQFRSGKCYHGCCQKLSEVFWYVGAVHHECSQPVSSHDIKVDVTHRGL